MIIVRAPLRLSFFGGSTDYESFYKEYGSLLLGTTINKHVYVSYRQRPTIIKNTSIISYSEQEIIPSCEWDKVKHPLVRETLKLCRVEDAIDLHTFSDIPSRTGLGGSSAFCVALLMAITGTRDKRFLANEAVRLERKILGEPGGIQDQIWSSYGGLNSIEIRNDGMYQVKPLPISPEFATEFQKSLVLVYTGKQRSDSETAQKHDEREKEQYKLAIRQISQEAYVKFEEENIKEIGKLLQKSWQEKKKISSDISNDNVDEISRFLLNSGCYGTKLCGAGDAGFVLGVGPEIAINKIKKELTNSVLEFNFESGGVCSVFQTK